MRMYDAYDIIYHNISCLKCYVNPCVSMDSSVSRLPADALCIGAVPVSARPSGHCWARLLHRGRLESKGKPRGFSVLTNVSAITIPTLIIDNKYNKILLECVIKPREVRLNQEEGISAFPSSGPLLSFHSPGFPFLSQDIFISAVLCGFL